MIDDHRPIIDAIVSFAWCLPQLAELRPDKQSITSVPRPKPQPWFSPWLRPRAAPRPDQPAIRVSSSAVPADLTGRVGPNATMDHTLESHREPHIGEAVVITRGHLRGHVGTLEKYDDDNSKILLRCPKTDSLAWFPRKVAKFQKTGQEVAPAEADRAQVPTGMKLEKVHEANADLQLVIQQSKLEGVSPPLLANGYVPLRLTRMAQTPAVDEALLSAPSVKHCHELVSEAGCDFKPPWGHGARFLIPFTEEQLQEFVDQGIEPSNRLILALRKDVPAIKQALKAVGREQRPHVQEEQRDHALATGRLSSEFNFEETEAVDDDFVLEVVTAVESTDSDFGYMGEHPTVSASSSSWHHHLHQGVPAEVSQMGRNRRFV